MIQALQAVLGPYYLYVKFTHVFFVMIWVWSTAVAYAFYLVPVFKAWRRNPDDPEIIEMRNWTLERFDHGVSYEHIAFPLVIVTGPLLYVLGGWSTAIGWLLLKLLIVTGIFLPIEIADYYLSHLGGNKHRIRLQGDPVRYERAVHRHWWFLLISSPTVMIFGVLVIFLAITKPF